MNVKAIVGETFTINTPTVTLQGGFDIYLSYIFKITSVSSDYVTCSIEIYCYKPNTVMAVNVYNHKIENNSTTIFNYSSNWTCPGSQTSIKYPRAISVNLNYGLNQLSFSNLYKFRNVDYSNSKNQNVSISIPVIYNGTPTNKIYYNGVETNSIIFN